MDNVLTEEPVDVVEPAIESIEDACVPQENSLDYSARYVVSGFYCPPSNCSKFCSALPLIKCVHS